MIDDDLEDDVDDLLIQDAIALSWKDDNLEQSRCDIQIAYYIVS